MLEPRPWTEMQSNWAAEISPTLPHGPILELCAGAGHIGLLAAVLTGRALVQVDVNETAAMFARQNARAASLTRQDFRVSAIADALEETERFALILADPPYIPTREVGLFPDDPVVAIDGGEDGLAVLESSVDAARVHLCQGGALLLQARGAAQAAEVARLARGLRLVEIREFDDQRAVAKFERVQESESG